MKEDEKIKNVAEDSKKDICPECRAKLTAAMKNLKKTDMLRPNRLARKFAALVCDKCTDKIRGRLLR